MLFFSYRDPGPKIVWKEFVELSILTYQVHGTYQFPEVWENSTYMPLKSLYFIKTPRWAVKKSRPLFNFRIGPVSEYFRASEVVL